MGGDGDTGERGRAGEPDFAVVAGAWGPGPLVHECAAPGAGWSAPGESARGGRRTARCVRASPAPPASAASLPTSLAASAPSRTRRARARRVHERPLKRLAHAVDGLLDVAVLRPRQLLEHRALALAV